MLTIINNNTNPYYNLALEEYVFKQINIDEPIFILWQNKPSVVIGRNQNTFKEVNLPLIHKHKIPVVRRISGGGAVYHDLGNLNFTFISKDSEKKVEENISIMVDSLKSLGINAYFSGKNDILVDGYKVSGNAYFSENEILCHHGTLLVDANINKLSNYLKVSELKLKSKGIDSVKSRVINLNEINNDLNVDILKNTLLEKFENIFNTEEIYYIDENSELKLSKYIKKYNSWEWNFGSSPQFDITFKNRFTWGEVDINLIIEDGDVLDLKVYSDCNDPNFSQNIEAVLIGTKFQRKYFVECVNKLNDERKFDLINWFNDIEF